MGSVSVKSIEKKSSTPIPQYHFKCRYDKDDEHAAETPIFTRTTDIYRFKVPRDKLKWTEDYAAYVPTEYTSEKIKSKNVASYKDPDLDSPEYRTIKFNELDETFKCDRRSHHGPYKFVQYNSTTPILVPCNPVGRTGIIGRGHLGRWGPNHAADPIVTQWKRDVRGKIIVDSKSGKPILQFVAIQRCDTLEWAIPGGMIDPGEVINKTLIREFTEEALSKNLEFDKSDSVDAKNKFEEKLGSFFKNGIQIFKGYVDDPRNTDNAWMETLACNYHDEKSKLVGLFQLKGGDDAKSARWMDLDSTLSLFASHTDFLHSVAKLHKAHW